MLPVVGKYVFIEDCDQRQQIVRREKVIQELVGYSVEGYSVSTALKRGTRECCEVGLN